MANRKWTQSERELIVRMWRAGSTQAEIASAIGHGVGRGDINAQVQYMRSRGVDLPLRRIRINVDALNAI